jgi:diphthamide biosynthesis protein 2
MAEAPVHPQVAPVLSTPDANIFEDPTPVRPSTGPRLSDADIRVVYEIERTAKEIREGKWRRVALQFPDEMLQDAPRVFEALQKELKQFPSFEEISTDTARSGQRRLFILADTSYGSCCVDEIAAEHVDADVVVHYGRSCLSPTARLPVIYVFTNQALDMSVVLEYFKRDYAEKGTKVILMADVTYQSHLSEIAVALTGAGYTNVYTNSILHDPSSPIPNRTTPEDVQTDTAKLKEWQLFHISEPPQALILTLSARVAGIRIFPTTNPGSTSTEKEIQKATSLSLRRRYALLTSLSTVSIFGILINTLSVKNYLHIVKHVKKQILAAGKKSYTFVVGKVNAAKIANFSEVGGWVVIGCWESSLLESKDFWKPVITPFELELALQRDSDRVWTGDWRSDFQTILDQDKPTSTDTAALNNSGEKLEELQGLGGQEDVEDSEEDAPPEFDLRTGRYIQHSRPMRRQQKQSTNDANGTVSQSLVKRDKGDIAVIGNEVSPGAQFLNTKRTWNGLGSDFEIAYEESGKETGAAIEEGRSGIARGYTLEPGKS